VVDLRLPGCSDWRLDRQAILADSGADMSVASKLLIIGITLAGVSSAIAEAPFGVPAICRTAIGSIAGRDPKSIHTSSSTEGILFLTYTRPFDNFVWTYRCRVEGNRIVWASEPGRWRDGPKDDKIFFEIAADGAQLRIVRKQANGSTKSESFDRDMVQ
jgi:hypothetical protein